MARLTLNPFFILFFIYFSANTYKLINVLFDGGFQFLGGYYEVGPEVALIGYGLQVFSLLFVLMAYVFFCNRYVLERDLGRSWGVFLIAVTVAFFVFNQVTGAGRAGAGFSFDGGSYLNYFFVFLQPDVWFFLIAPFLRSNRIFLIAILIYLISLFSRGWMGSVLLVAIVWLIRYYPIRIDFKTFWKWFSFCVLVVALLPVLDAFKWGYRLGVPTTEILSELFDRNYFSVLGVVFESVVDRFSNLHMVIISLEKSAYIFDRVLGGEVRWFYQNGILNAAYCKFYQCGTDLNTYYAELLTGQVNLSWNLDTGLSGWLAVLGIFFPFIILYSFLMVYGGVFVFSKFMGERGCLLISSFSLIYFFHGWFNAYFNLILYMFVFIFFYRFRLFVGSHSR